ncbi:hypothetical protein Nhal_2151 [Nitrosococcus halophilus Nc 4]|uniref:Uncharacterized protein n=1 Tax=Nitrosococcus halophilus (strain Nc4) TaxID=472759 RepID=D5C527_NITHN|nr:hypothetical protein Nhal_2151 [Nitrosococcus halophilus Nc 4]
MIENKPWIAFLSNGYCHSCASIGQAFAKSTGKYASVSASAYKLCIYLVCLCRNLVYTYFQPDLQREITQQLYHSLQCGGILVLGIHEALPESIPGFYSLFREKGIYIKS